MAEHAHAEAAPETTAAPTPLVALRGASQQSQIGDAHTRGKEMAKIAIKKLRDYDGSSPAEVKTALKKHFGKLRGRGAVVHSVVRHQGLPALVRQQGGDAHGRREEGYADASTIRQLANSDAYGMLCFDVRLP